MSIMVMPVTEHVFPQSGAVFHCHQDRPIYCFCLTREMSTMPGSDRKDGCNLKDPTTSDSHIGAPTNQSDSDYLRLKTGESKFEHSGILMSF